jgi:hypothetical protein
MKIINVDSFLDELKQIHDKGKELLLLNDLRNEYKSMDEKEKQDFDLSLKTKIQALHEQTIALLGEKA